MQLLIRVHGAPTCVNSICRQFFLLILFFLPLCFLAVLIEIEMDVFMCLGFSHISLHLIEHVEWINKRGFGILRLQSLTLQWNWTHPSTLSANNYYVLTGFAIRYMMPDDYTIVTSPVLLWSERDTLVWEGPDGEGMLGNVLVHNAVFSAKLFCLSGSDTFPAQMHLASVGHGWLTMWMLIFQHFHGIL